MLGMPQKRFAALSGDKRTIRLLPAGSSNEATGGSALGKLNKSHGLSP